MLRGWFKHGKWTKYLVRLHYYSMVSFVLLMLTGIALFWPPVHTVLIPYLPVLYYVHISLGALFAVTLLIPLIVRLPVGKLIRKFDWLFPLVFGTVIVLSGVLMWQVTWFPTEWRSLAFRWHGWVSYLLGTWFIAHGIYKALGYRPSDKGVNGRINPERRQFLKWIGAGVLGTVVIGVIDPVTVVRHLLSSGSGSAGPVVTGGRFVEYYTVTNGYPDATLTSYQLHVGGLVERPLTLNWSQLTALPSVHESEDFHCVTGWSVAGVQWKGVRLSSIMTQVKPLSEAKYVHFYSFDGVYTECLSMQEALDRSVMLAYQLNSQPLSTQQGFPVRLVVPKMYGYKSIKWVKRLEFSSQPLTGYWEARGCPDEAYVGRSI